MAKVVGAIFTIIGGLITLFTSFLIMNTSAYLPYHPDDKPLYLMETGYILPGLGGLFLLIAGIAFIMLSDEK